MVLRCDTLHAAVALTLDLSFGPPVSFWQGPVYADLRWNSPSNDGCCVKMCNGHAEVGYRCPTKSNGLPSAAFNKVVIGCNSVQLVC
ncbi:hypothetical protein KFL_003330090 [Klebsormidium nitens]|uniref:Uncharacterized protein n=1 Tax=Klebsormidium nitens TaxID=105231 RepID=A0A1Y1IEJ6_KLENI|nr:hypothetical protein KFL_003330090 [Klebsormidium nitens]|eukprot:GAQ87127.1 hypothetical protein KFL_003330090 [Klebsormidium nitens]